LDRAPSLAQPFRRLLHFTFQAEKENPLQTAMLLALLAQFISMVQTQIVARLKETLAEFRH
jgi:hypothetical protein